VVNFYTGDVRLGNSLKGSLSSSEVQTAAHDIGAVALRFSAGVSKLQGSVGAAKGSNRCGDLRR
jgi:hypothetical protein